MVNNMELERSIIACMLINRECSLECNSINTDDFADLLHQDIFEAIKTLVKQNKAVDYLTVYNQLNKSVDVTFLATISNSLPTTANFKQYVDELKDVSLKRKLFGLANELVDTNRSGKELAEYAEQEIFNLRQETSTNNFTKIKDIIVDVNNDIQEIYMGRKQRGLSTGFNVIDQIVEGLRKKEYILLAARPSIGKTALANNIATNLIMTNKSVAFFSFEMGKEQLVERILKSRAMINNDKFRKQQGQKMEDEDWLKLIEAANGLFNRNLFIDDDPNKSVSDMASMCRKLKREQGLDLVIVDYLQKIRSNVKGNKREQVEQISNDLKNMAKLLDVPVVVISSLSRSNEQRESKIPQMSDLRESGQIEFDADVIMFLHREYYYKPLDKNLEYDADLIIAKNRNGAVGRGKLMWFAGSSLFTNVDRGRAILENKMIN